MLLQGTKTGAIIKPLINLKRLAKLRTGVAAALQAILVNILIVGVSFGTGIITARLLGPVGRGEQAAILIWPQFLSQAFAFGLPVALLYNLKRYSDRTSQTFSVALLLGAPVGGLVAVGGMLFVPHWLTEYSSEVVRFAQLSMLITPVYIMTLILASAFQGREEFTLYNVVRCVPPLLTLLALVLLALTYHLTPFSAALAYLLSIVPVFLWGLIRLWRIYRPRWYGPRWVFKTFKPLASYGLRSWGIDFAGQLAFFLDRVLVVGLLSPAAMGLYVVALSLAQILQVFQSAVVSVLFPKAFGRSVEEVATLTGWAARVSSSMTLLAALGFAVCGPWLLSLFYGQEYLDAVAVFRLLVIQVALSGTTWVLAQAFMALNRPGKVALLQGVGLGLTVPLVLVLVPRYGLEGAGLALLISSSVRLVCVIASFPLFLKVRVPRFRPTWSDLRAIFREKEERTEG